MAHLGRRAALLVAALSFGFACGPTENQWPATPVPEYSYSDFAKQLPEYLCDRLMRCPTAKDDDLVSRLLFQSIPRCTDILKTALSSSARVFDPRPAIATGHMVFHGDAARAYLASLDGPCDSRGAKLDPTDGGALEGTVATDGACSVSAECKRGDYCEHQAGACPGACAELKSAGAACSSGAECTSTYCNAGTCGKLTVNSPAAAGQPCGFVDGADATETPCAGDLWCDGNPTGACRRAIPGDAPCSNQNDVCEVAHLCLTDVDGVKRCRPVTVAEQGALCTDETSPDVRYCDAFSFLSCTQGTCSGPTGSAEGAACVRTDFSDSCDPGLHCASGTHVCKKLGQAGDACTGTEDCASGYCISGSGTCSDSFCD